ncbi:hypothetical protein [Chondromyces apiculatus]|uniref:Uncharacterized protein n=1 Tax=Chondromyces apiculatus DSM 436 TaxID=1192034 RepID=A0A017T4Y6_9BACT|nr:hypothetical protein [Chondromyces apiculatus]EYF03611.1 Hypothetical protein CAP_5402 [Chondromyces apiculatus DSM 436]
MDLEARANHARYAGQQEGFYESYFQRANHPTRPLAFWVRYTLFSPAKHPEAARGELWAIVFDGESGVHHVAKQEVPFAGRCTFARDSFSVRVGDALLAPGEMTGEIGAGDAGSEPMAWALSWEGGERPLFLLPPALYAARLPRAKSLVSVPLCTYRGVLRAGSREIPVDGWLGSQNHNWGTRHTDRYTWAQVAGFDGAPGTFLEVATARLRFGPVWTPPMTPLVLRHAGEEIALRSVRQSLRNAGSVQGFSFHVEAEDARAAVEGSIEAEGGDFVGLRYDNPPGGDKDCLNTKIASCTLTLRRKRGGRLLGVETLRATRRAAFEILTEDRTHGVPIRA